MVRASPSGRPAGRSGKCILIRYGPDDISAVDLDSEYQTIFGSIPGSLSWTSFALRFATARARP